MKLSLSFILLACWLGSSSVLAQTFPASRNPFGAIMNVSDIPQFVVITLDDTVTTTSMSSLRPITTLRDRYDCGIRVTTFVNTQSQSTDCTMISALVQGEHEIAISTYENAQTPSPEDILNARNWLNQECLLPLEQVQGFRALGRRYSQETWDALDAQGFLYDSSLTTTDHRLSNYGRQHYWPFTLDQELPTSLDCSCTRNKTLPSLWQVPVWTLYDSSNNNLFYADLTDPIDALTENFRRHYNGNRAPLGIYINVGWLLQNNFSLKQWIQEIMDTYPDVHFVTISEVLEWMQNPIKKRRYRERCEGQESECFTPLPIDCRFGAFNPDSCSCDCYDGYCKDSAGQCTQTTGCGDVDGGWTDYQTNGICCDEQELLTRTCTNPSPEGDGKDCEGSSQKVDYCFPENCPNGGWSEWSDYDECCEGEQTKIRECLAAPSINSGRGCIGQESQTDTCGPDVCKKRYYPNYDRGACDRLPLPPSGSTFANGNNNYEDCCSEHFSWNQAACIDGSENPPIDGGWSNWNRQGPCCGGRRSITRTCTEPAPANKGEDCVGDALIIETCSSECTNNGWSEWSDYQPCCDRESVRTRTCLAPPGIECQGSAEESIFCQTDVCTKIFSPNFNVQICVRILEGEETPVGVTGSEYGSADECCTTNFPQNYDKCVSNVQIPVDGGWGEWSDYGLCFNEVKVRFRGCNNPTPQNGGLECEGESSQQLTCEAGDPGFNTGLSSDGFTKQLWFSLTVAVLSFLLTQL